MLKCAHLYSGTFFSPDTTNNDIPTTIKSWPGCHANTNRSTCWHWGELISRDLGLQVDRAFQERGGRPDPAASGQDLNADPVMPTSQCVPQ